MNFKDAYKSMNDDIHGDKALMHMIMNGEAPKKKKSLFLKFKPIYSVALAAVFAVCVVTLYRSTGFEEYSATTDKFNDVIVDGEAPSKDTKAANDEQKIDIAPDQLPAQASDDASGEQTVQTSPVPSPAPSADRRTVGASSYGQNGSATATPHSSQTSSAQQSSVRTTQAASEGAAENSVSQASANESDSQTSAEPGDAPRASGGSAQADGSVANDASSTKLGSGAGKGLFDSSAAEQSMEDDFESACENILSEVTVPSDVTQVGQTFSTSADSNANSVSVNYEGSDGRTVNIVISESPASSANSGSHTTQYGDVTVTVSADGLSEDEVSAIVESVTKN
ncbi:MAG: hypothetical protein IJB70_00755 [Clostridia bacterium]|nr:hypothetical protein [Clostridia bacterium]